MGKASSSKKVARAAGTGGGRTTRGRIPTMYYSVIAAVIILGLVGTVTSRDRRLAQINTAGGTAPTVGTTWFEGYAVYECGKFVTAISHAKDPQGITTGNADGVIHIAPTVKASAGKNATLGKFASAVGMKLNAAELQLPGGKLYQDGDTCQGKKSHVYIKQFGFAGDKTGALQTVDPRDVLLQNGALLTIAFGPASDSSKIPAPPAYVNTNLAKLSAAATSTSSTTIPSTSVTTTPGQTTATTKAPTATTSPATTAPATTPTTKTSATTAP